MNAKELTLNIAVNLGRLCRRKILDQTFLFKSFGRLLYFKQKGDPS